MFYMQFVQYCGDYDKKILYSSSKMNEYKRSVNATLITTLNFILFYQKVLSYR